MKKMTRCWDLHSTISLWDLTETEELLMENGIPEGGAQEVLTAICMALIDCNPYVEGIGNDEDNSFRFRTIMNAEKVERAEKVLMENGIDEERVEDVCMTLGYTLLDLELYDEED